MSYTVRVIEELKINNCNNKTKVIAKDLENYIDDLNNFRSIKELSIEKLTLTVDGERAEIKQFRADIYGYDEDEQIVLWDKNSDIVRLSSKLASAQRITFEVNLLITKNAGVDYGISRWNLDRNDELKQNVSVRCISLCEDEGTYSVYKYNENEAGCVVESSETLLDNESVNEWNSIDFKVDVELDADQSFSNEDRVYLTEWAEEFSRRYGGMQKEPYDFGKLNGEEYFEFFEVPFINVNQLDEFKQYIQTLVDYTWSRNMWVNVVCTFMPSEYGFTVVELELNEGKVELKYYSA